MKEDKGEKEIKCKEGKAEWESVRGGQRGRRRTGRQEGKKLEGDRQEGRGRQRTGSRGGKQVQRHSQERVNMADSRNLLTTQEGTAAPLKKESSENGAPCRLYSKPSEAREKVTYSHQERSPSQCLESVYSEHSNYGAESPSPQ